MTDPVIEVRNLIVRRAGTTALNGVHLAAMGGAVVLITGPSGSGKSTLAGVLAGFYADGSRGTATGHVRVAGLNPLERGVGSMASAVGMLFQNPAAQLFGLTVESEVAAGMRSAGLSPDETERRVEEAMSAAAIGHLRDRKPWELSSGEQQRVALAAVLAHRPPVLVLDEPTGHVDDEACGRLSCLLKETASRGVTVVLMEHRWDRLDIRPYAVFRLCDGQLFPVGDGLAGLPAPLPGQLCPQTEAAEAGRETLLRLDGVGLTVGNRRLLQDAHLSILRGDRTAIVGPNGSGKTTLARAMAGLQRVQSGRCWRKGRVVLVQSDVSVQIIEDTVAEEIGDPAIMERAGLRHLARRSGTQTSLGEQMRIVVAAALATRPDVLILDEPAVGQDRGALERMLMLTEDALGTRGARLMITHDERLARACANRVYRLSDLGLCPAVGRVASPEPACHAV